MSSKSPSGFPESLEVAKAQARRLAGAIAPYAQISHSQALEVVSKMHGERNWGAMNARFAGPPNQPEAYDLGLRHVETGQRPPDYKMRGWKAEELDRFVELLRTHPRVTPSVRYRRILDEIIEERCLSAGYLDKLLDAVSRELGDFSFALKGNRVLELFGIGTESYFYRPNELSDGTTGHHAVSIAGAATLLIKLEHLGLDTHPEHLVSAVNKSAPRGMLTSDELRCLWYRTEKEGAGRQRLMVSPYVEDTDATGEVFVTATGYSCTVYRGEDGDIEVVVLDPPSPHRTSAATSGAEAT